MCGIVGAISQRNVPEILLQGLQRLEYRGYDSAGIAALNEQNVIQRHRVKGKVKELVAVCQEHPLSSSIGIAHTRWATHGEPIVENAHPHMSGDQLAVVHNGIIENYQVLQKKLIARGYEFTSETDTEIIAHLIHDQLKTENDLLTAVRKTADQLMGAFALAVITTQHPDCIVAVKKGSPLVIGLGIDENLLASDCLALAPWVNRFIHLEEGDIAEIKRETVHILDQKGETVERTIQRSTSQGDVADKGEYRHYMLKEIFEQTKAIQATLEGRLGKEKVYSSVFGRILNAYLSKVAQIHIVACGTSYHAGMIARSWFEELLGLPCQVEIASEYRYRRTVVQPNTLFIAISQSGETADTLGALRLAKKLPYLTTLAICNVAESSLVREADTQLMTRAGIEIGVASTKAFTTQLTVLLLLTLALHQSRSSKATAYQHLIDELHQLPNKIEEVLTLDDEIKQLSQQFADKEHALFLGRGAHYPVALEGSLKLKELSYIHAEAYPAGELKHGPLALVDKNMPVIAVAPNDDLLEKLKSNLQEVRARGGELFVFADGATNLSNGAGTTIISMPTVHKILSPILYTLPLQLLAYHVAVLKGTDVDQPRNLAKSVTVE